MSTKSSLIIGISLILGLSSLGYIAGKSLITSKELERTIVVKGLAQKEVKANLVIWPIKFLKADNNITNLYVSLEADALKITAFLLESGFKESEISLSAPSITDKFAQNYGNSNQIKFRYSGIQAITVYTNKVDLARKAMIDVSQLGQEGIAFVNNYDSRVEYVYNQLNAIKPQMIEEATKSARETAKKFADDSKSNLGKIKKARQGQFSIQARDTSTPYIKKVRIVSTIEYYLVDW